MKSRHQRHGRKRGQPDERKGPLPGSRTGRAPLIASALVLGAVVIATAGWFAVRQWRHSDTTRLSPSSTTQTNLPGAAPGSRHATNNANRDQAFITRVNHANELLTQGKVPAAVAALTEAARMKPDDEDVHYDLGLALTRQGRFEDAVKEYEEALRLFPDYVEAHNNLGNVLMRLGRMDEAVKHYEAAVNIMPDYASAQNNLGTALQRAGRTNEALAHFEQAVKLNPDYWQAHYNVGTSYFEQGRLDAARNEFETVLRLAPDFKPAQAALARLDAEQAGGVPLKP